MHVLHCKYEQCCDFHTNKIKRKEVAWVWLWEETGRNFTSQATACERPHSMRSVALFCIRLTKKNQCHIWVFANVLYRDNKDTLQRTLWCDLKIHIQNKLLPCQLLTTLNLSRAQMQNPTRCTSSVCGSRNKLAQRITCALQHTTGRQQTSHEENQSRINSLQSNAQKSVV